MTGLRQIIPFTLETPLRGRVARGGCRPQREHPSPAGAHVASVGTPNPCTQFDWPFHSPGRKTSASRYVSRDSRGSRNRVLPASTSSSTRSPPGSRSVRSPLAGSQSVCRARRPMGEGLLLHAPCPTRWWCSLESVSTQVKVTPKSAPPRAQGAYEVICVGQYLV